MRERLWRQQPERATNQTPTEATNSHMRKWDNKLHGGLVFTSGITAVGAGALGAMGNKYAVFSVLSAAAAGFQAHLMYRKR